MDNDNQQDVGRPGLARHDARDRSGSWPRQGPLPVEVRDGLAAGFGARVRELRRAQKVTQVRLAELLCCDERTIRRLETGQHRPTRQQIAWLARALVADGQPPQQLDFELLNLAGRHVRELRRRRRRRGELNGLYMLPSEREAQVRELQRQAQHALERVRRLI